MDWTDRKLDQLREYIDRYQHVDNLEELNQVIDWTYLQDTFKISDISIVMQKVEELYQENKEAIYTNPIFLDEDLSDVRALARVEGNPFLGEIASMLEALGLHEFLTEKDLIEEDRDQQSMRESNWELDKVLQALPPDSRKVSLNLPNMTNKEQQVSLNLMDQKNRPNLIPFAGDNSSKRASLSKPASAEITSVNILSKADAISGIMAKPVGDQRRKSLTSPFLIVDKLKFIRRKSVEPDSVPVFDKASINAKSPQRMNKDKARRTSMVGDSLPLYIRQQLGSPEQPLNLKILVLESRTVLPKVPQLTSLQPPLEATGQYSILTSYAREALPLKEISKQPSSRLKNVLSNSQSLYAISRDAVHPGTPSRDESQTSTISDELTDRVYDSDDDKEYILPTLMSRYLGLEGDDEGDDDDDFPDLDFIKLHDSESDRITGRTIDEEDDDYLFS